MQENGLTIADTYLCKLQKKILIKNYRLRSMIKILLDKKTKINILCL